MWHDFNQDRTKVLHVCLKCKYNEAWHSKWHGTLGDWDKLECCKCGETVWRSISDDKQRGAQL